MNKSRKKLLFSCSLKYFSEVFYILASNCGEQLNYKEYPNYYVGGRCSVCGLSYGERTENNLIIKFKIPNTDTISIDHSNVMIFSERVIDILNLYNESLFHLKEVGFERRIKGDFYAYKMKNKFFEIIWDSSTCKTDSIALKDNSIGLFHGWKCSKCSAHGSFHQNEEGLFYYVSNDFIQEKKSDLFLLNNRILCVSERVKKDLDRLGLKNLSLDPIGIVSTEDIKLNPKIEIRYPIQKTPPKLP